MKQFIVLLVAIITFCTAVYGQVEEGASQPTALNFDEDQLLDRLAAIKPFKPEEGETSSGYAFVVTQEQFRNSLILLIKEKEKVDEVMADFVSAVALPFKDNTQLLTLTQWKDQESAKKFMQLRYELWCLTDEKDPSLITNVMYQEIDIAKGEKALLTRKTLVQTGKQKYPTTSFLSSRKHYVFECNLIGNYGDQEVKKIILQIWKIIKSEEKRGAR